MFANEYVDEKLITTKLEVIDQISNKIENLQEDDDKDALEKILQAIKAKKIKELTALYA